MIPVDRTGERYRYHRLVRDTLRAELRREPELESELHRRASAWHRAAARRRSGRAPRARGRRRARRPPTWSGATSRRTVADGQTGALERWLSRFTESQISRQPAARAHVAAGCELVRGQGHLVDHWASVAADAPQPAGIPRRRSRRAVALLARRDGRRRARPGCARTRECGPRAPAGPAARAARSPASSEGVASHLLGDRDEATRRLEEGARHAAVLAPARARAVPRPARGAGARARGLGRGDRAQHAAPAPRSTVTGCASLSHERARASRSPRVARAHRGRIEEAQRTTRSDATPLQAPLTDFAAWYGAEVHILLARAALRLSDVGVARAHVSEAARVLRRVPEAVALAAAGSPRRRHSSRRSRCPRARSRRL